MEIPLSLLFRVTFCYPGGSSDRSKVTRCHGNLTTSNILPTWHHHCRRGHSSVDSGGVKSPTDYHYQPQLAQYFGGIKFDAKRYGKFDGFHPTISIVWVGDSVIFVTPEIWIWQRNIKATCSRWFQRFFTFIPTWEDDPIGWLIICQMGWNHQLILQFKRVTSRKNMCVQGVIFWV